MGKIKVATLGSDNEEALRSKEKTKREEKKKREHAQKVHVSGMKGGQRIKSGSDMSEEELNRMARLTEEVERDEREGIHPDKKEEKKKKIKVRVRGRKYQSVLTKIEHNKVYDITEAVKLLRDVSITKFDGTVEVHINTVEKGLRGAVTLPHGTGKAVRVKVVDGGNVELLLADVEAGKFDFDILVAHPQVMPKLAKVARHLGPKGLMPNPKNGTISTEPEKVARKFAGGEINWKTEAEFPLIHHRLGKMSFKDNQLEDNFKAFIKSVNPIKIKAVTIKSTMSPGIKVKFA